MSDIWELTKENSLVNKKSGTCLNFGLKDLSRVAVQLNAYEDLLDMYDEEKAELEAQVEFYKSYYINFNEKVIEELKNVTNSILDTNNGYWHFGETPFMPVCDLIVCLKEYIDDKIKELKGE